MTRGPFEQAARLYASHGFPGTVPLSGKIPSHAGLTGASGIDPSPGDREQLIVEYGHGNIGLRLPYGVVGIDVDVYGDKHGHQTIQKIAEATGEPLPATWTSTARGPGSSRIHLFRAALPEGRRWRNQPDVEIIHRGHRHTVVWPSIHPQTGQQYRWYNPYGVLAVEGEIPTPADLAVLPASWIHVLSQSALAATDGAAQQWAEGLRSGEMCDPVRNTVTQAIAALSSPDADKHNTMRDAQLALAGHGMSGHAGVLGALGALREAFLTAAPGREGEWSRALTGAAAKASNNFLSLPPQDCDCALLSADLTLPPIEELLSAEVREEFEEARNSGGPMVQEFLPASRMKRPDGGYLVKGVLKPDSLAWLIGASGTFKSFVAMDLAARVAMSSPWLGRKTKSSGRPIMYVVAEGAAGILDRTEAWAAENQLPYPDEVLFRCAPLLAKDDEAWANLRWAASALRPSIIVLDTQARVSVGYDENSNSEMGDFISRLDALRVASDGACVLIVHHTGRAEGATTARGASAIDGAQDTELRLARDGKEMSVDVWVEKQKDGAEGRIARLELVEVDLGRDDEGDPISSLAARHITDGVTEAKKAGFDRTQVRNLAGRLTEIARNVFPNGGGTKAEYRREWTAFRQPAAAFNAVWDLASLGNSGPDGQPLLLELEGRRFVSRADWSQE